jgi:hypothetical protein
LSVVDHVNKFLLEIVEVFMGGLVRATRKGAFDLKPGPGWGGKLDRRAMVLVEV